MNLVLISLVFIFFLFNASISNSEQVAEEVENKNCLSKYNIKISLDSNEYFIFQSIFLNIEFEYRGKKVDSINLNSVNLTGNIIVKNLDGKISGWSGAVDYPFYIKFLPGEKKAFKVDLSYHFGFEKFETPNLFGLYTYFPPDIYSVQYVIKNSIEFLSPSYLKKCKSIGKFFSNIIHFKTIEPTGINKEAFEIIKKLYNIDKMGGKNTEEYIKLGNIIIKEYYNSVYINKIFGNISAMRQIRKIYDSSAIEEAMIILNNHPNDLISRSAISQAYNYYKANYNEERALQFLEEAKVNYRNQEAGKWAEHELNRIRGN